MSVPVFWLLFTALGVWAHSFIPGLDCFAPALIVCLHLRRYRTAFWLGSAWLLINEGAGTLAFGTSIVWYCGLILFFFLIQLFLSARHIYFALTMALFAGGWQFFVFSSMVRLQEFEVARGTLLSGSLSTMLFFPVGWFLVQGLAEQKGGRTSV
ncbi:MAG: hypothetical protein K9K64_12470 [Desulfohalobiaceae bacterium]|nr:hypothetical protein [Desulfohalobiaceae bacterium]